MLAMSRQMSVSCPWPPRVRLCSLLLVGALSALRPGFALAAPSPTLADYRATYEKELGKIRTNNAPVVAADNDYVKTLDALQTDCKKRGDFENTMALIAEQKRFDATKMVPNQPPTNPPPVIAKAQADYRAALARAEIEREKQIAKLNTSYAKAIKELIKTYLAADKLVEAEAANKELKRAEAELKWAEETIKAASAVVDKPDTPSSGAPDSGSAPAPGGNAAGNLPANLRQGLVLYYSFDKDEGNVVTDKSPERNAGMVHGAKWTAEGIVGGAYEFDGEKDYLTVKPKTHMQGVGDFSVSLWTYVLARKMQVTGSGVQVDRQYIFDTQTDAVSGQYRNGFYLIFDFMPNGISEVHNGILLDQNKGGYSEQNTRVDVAGGWHHLVFLRHGKTDNTYLDGKPQNSTYAAEVRRADRLDLNHTWSIGTFAGNNNPGSRQVNYSFKGRIDEIMVFTRALTDAEIKQIYGMQKQ